MSSPTSKCEFSFSFERDLVCIGGRYCKFSRSLPQSPWATELGEDPEPGKSVGFVL